MITSGDIVIAKPKFLIDHGIPWDKREFIVLQPPNSSNSGFCVLSPKDNSATFTMQGEALRANFYLSTGINNEILKLIENDEVEFVSFRGKTRDGKEIIIKMGEEN